eukprot:sb/3477274/
MKMTTTLSEHWPDPILARELWPEHWPDSYYYCTLSLGRQANANALTLTGSDCGPTPPIMSMSTEPIRGHYFEIQASDWLVHRKMTKNEDNQAQTSRSDRKLIPVALDLS